MSRILFTLAALAFLGAAGMLAVRGDGHLALGALVVMAVLFVLAVAADRKGEGMPDVPRPSAP